MSDQLVNMFGAYDPFTYCIITPLFGLILVFAAAFGCFDGRHVFRLQPNKSQ